MIKKLHKVGGQNPIEAAKLGCKIYHGPYIYNFKEIYDFLKPGDLLNEPLPESYARAVQASKAESFNDIHPS